MPVPYAVPSGIDDASVGGKVRAASWNEVRDGFAFVMNPPWVLCYVGGAGQVVATASSATVAWTDEVYDGYGLHSPAASTRLTIPAGYGGIWQFEAQISWPSGGGNRVAAWIVNSGTTYGRYQSSAGSTTHIHHTCSQPIALVAGDFIELDVQQSSGGNLTITPGQDDTWIAGRWRSLT